MSEVNSEKPKVTRRSSLRCRRINVKPNPAPAGAVKKNGKRSSISWGQIDTFEFKEMKPTFQENTEINKEKTKESEERHKKFLETRRRSITNEFISDKDMMKACINFIEEIFDEEKNKSKKKELEKINETQESDSSSKNEDNNKKDKKSKNSKKKESSSSSDNSSSESSCSSPNCLFRKEFNRKNNENKKDKENDKKIEKKELKSPKFEKKKENNKTLKFKMEEIEKEKEKEDLEDTEKEKEEKIVIKKNKNVEKKNEGKKLLKEKIIKKEEKIGNKEEKEKEKEKKKNVDIESKEEELEKRKEEPENKIKNEQKGKIMSEFRASNNVRLISYKEARELDLDTVAYIVLTDGSVLVVRKEYGNKKQNIIKKKMNNKPITNLSKRIINKNYQALNNNNNNNNGNIPPQIQMNEIQLPNFKKIILQNEIQEKPVPSIYPKQNFNFNTQIFPNNNISFLAQNYKKNFKKINNNLSLKLNKMSISPSLKMDRDKKTINYFSPKNMAKKRYINHNYAQSLKNISQSNNHPHFRKFIKISPQRELQSNRYTIINAIPFFDDNSNQILDNSSQVNAESVLFPDLGDSETNISQFNRYKTIKQPNFIYSPIKCNFNEDNYNSIDQLNI